MNLYNLCRKMAASNRGVELLPPVTRFRRKIFKIRVLKDLRLG